ncbi:MAG: alpha/beta hydrolase [Chloroflexi bacterium]|nr:alpha/beta hydrolase [Chloroflexota bacterium]
MRSKWVILDGLMIHSLVSATPGLESGPPVVILPGFSSSSQQVRPAAERLSAHFRTYAPDLPGFGRSDRPRVLPTLARLARFLEMWMQEMKLDGVALVGASFGAQIAVEFGARYPERVSRVVMVGPTVDPQARSLFRMTWRWLANASRENYLQGTLLKGWWRASPRRALHVARQAMQNPIEEKLPDLRAPTLVMRGERDPVCPQKWAEQIVSLLPDGRLEAIPGAAHSILRRWPEEFARRAIPFLSERVAVER